MNEYNEYEALGRYVAAEQEFINCSNERNNLLKRVTDLLNKTIYSSANKTIKWSVIDVLLESAKATDSKMIAAIKAANAVAEVAGKPKILLID